MTRFRDYPAPLPDMRPVSDATIRRFGRWAGAAAALAIGWTVGAAYVAGETERRVEMVEVRR